jgi:hypothetical protein
LTGHYRFWSATVEAELYAEQERVSETKEEGPYPAYAELALHW